MDRRHFVGTLASLGLAAACGRAGANSQATRSLERIGVQLYTVRDRMERDVAGTLRAVAEIGYREVETAGLFDHSPAEFRALLDETGLVSPAAHTPIQALRQDAAPVLASARTLGQRWVVVPWLDPAERTTDGYARLAADLNRFGAAARSQDLRIGYHNHEFEFDALPEGRSGYEILLADTDPELVDIELDLFWAVRAGQDPARLFAQHPGRFPLWHVKDMAGIGTEHRMVTVGQGDIDFAALFAQAELAGLRHFFVEHDNPDDSLQSIREGFRHLRQLET